MRHFDIQRHGSCRTGLLSLVGFLRSYTTLGLQLLSVASSASSSSSAIITTALGLEWGLVLFGNFPFLPFRFAHFLHTFPSLKRVGSGRE